MSLLHWNPRQCCQPCLSSSLLQYNPPIHMLWRWVRGGGGCCPAGKIGKSTQTVLSPLFEFFPSGLQASNTILLWRWVDWQVFCCPARENWTRQYFGFPSILFQVVIITMTNWEGDIDNNKNLMGFLPFPTLQNKIKSWV